MRNSNFLLKKHCVAGVSTYHLDFAYINVKTCKTCKATHNTLLHGAPRLKSKSSNFASNSSATPTPPDLPSSTSPVSLVSFATVVNSENSGKLLPFVPAIADSKDLNTRALVLLDQDSDTTYIKVGWSIYLPWKVLLFSGQLEQQMALPE